MQRMHFNLMLCGHTTVGRSVARWRAVAHRCRLPRALARRRLEYHILIGYTSVGAGSCIVDVGLTAAEVICTDLVCS